MKWWKFRPLDTWFFRGAMPFHSGESHAAQPESVFPPSMQTLQGAIRTTLAQGQGWTPRSGNPLPTALGDRNGLGSLRLKGPFLEFKNQWLFPAPRVLVGKRLNQKPWQLTRLRPGPKITCDWGEMAFPVPEQTQFKGKAMEVWLTHQGMEAVLNGEIPAADDIYTPESLWKPERRVGLMRDLKKRTARDHHLYMPIHTRPMPDLTIRVGVEGVPPDWHPDEVTIPLGGEGRLAAVKVEDAEKVETSWLPKLPDLQARKGRLYYTVSLVTPGDFEDIKKTIRQGPPGLPGRCRSASIGKPTLIGGWDLENNAPRPLRPLISVGSTWWMEAEDFMKEQIISFHGRQVGRNQEYGMGLLVIGIWDGEDEAQ